MKAFAVVFAFALVTLCAADDGLYRFNVKIPCDMVQEILVLDSYINDRVTVKMHRSFTITTTTLNTTTITRPDLLTPENRNFVFFSADGDCDAAGIPPNGFEPLASAVYVFENRVKDTYNGHECFRYYNNSNTSMWVDQDYYVWGIYIRDEEGTHAWSNFSYPTEPFTPDMFVFDESSGCGKYPGTLEVPDRKFFNGVCTDGTASHFCSLFLMVATLLFFLFF